ncbi:hypothetical protein CHS0354_005501 [Potamilus streckersoni]|uniref:Hcy-binding domain-containing protein n=1 Tax=Potamilus streckersoni TaxID=2493646 RepID=A0AAE0W1B3_9BIVA|nr:hypothetical protein CHS0354_005501 [Potamilus streckersoni]
MHEVLCTIYFAYYEYIILRISKGDPLWSSKLLHTNPEGIVQAHKNFLLAGAEAIFTVTYQAWVEGFQRHLGLTKDEAVKVMENGVRLARRACQEVSKETGEAEGLVAGSVGPYGASLHDGSEYTGIYIEKITSQELVDWHRPRVKALVDGGADFLAIETIPVCQEAEAIVRLLQEFPAAEASVSFSCKDGSHTCHGELFSDAVRSVCQSDQVIAVGLNCTSPQYVTPLLKSIEHLKIKKPILVKPNSGELWNAMDKRFYGQNHFQDLSDCIGDWIDQGARWIGGCCRVYPDDIKRIKDKIIQKVNE